MKHKAGIFTICLFLQLGITSQASASDTAVEITSNGSESVNEAVVQNQTTSQVTQENSANITNLISTNSSTGSNSINQNSESETQIVTGDVENNATVNNENINANYASGQDCNCNQVENSVISGNGVGLDNSAITTQKASTIVNQSNTARISNSIQVSADTGNNVSGFNSGSSKIVTGDIKASTTIINQNINNNVYSGSGSFHSKSSAVIVDNGAGSENSFQFEETDNVQVFTDNTAEISNIVEYDLNTGGNSILASLGDSVIITGNIYVDTQIVNENINSSFVTVESCGCEESPSSPSPVGEQAESSKPTPSHLAVTEPVSIVQSASGNAPGSAQVDRVLPQTGSTVPFSVIATMVLLFTFLTGLYLRFHSSNAPPHLA